MTINFKDFQKTLQENVEELDEALKGNQKKIDVDHDGKIEASDLKKLRKEDTEMKTFAQFMEELEEARQERGDEYGWDVKAPKEKPKATSRQVAGKAYGGAAQHDDEDDEDNDKPKAQPVKRGRGRPKGSASGARQQGNGTKKNYGGLTIHSLNLPSKK